MNFEAFAEAKKRLRAIEEALKQYFDVGINLDICISPHKERRSKL